MTEPAPLHYLVTFDRIGRKRGLALHVDAVGADDLAEHVYRFAGQHLASRAFSVVVDLDGPDGNTGKGSIDGGRFGTFTVSALAPEVVL